MVVIHRVTDPINLAQLVKDNYLPLDGYRSTIKMDFHCLVMAGS